MLLKKPDGFLKSIAKQQGYDLSEVYGSGLIFLNTDEKLATAAREQLVAELKKEGLEVLGWRQVPTNNDACGEEALASLPNIEQIFVNAPQGMDEEAFERHLYIARRRTEKVIEPNDDVFYVPSLSCRVFSYKGLVIPGLSGDWRNHSAFLRIMVK